MSGPSVTDMAFYTGVALLGYHYGGLASAGGLLIGFAVFFAIVGPSNND